MKTIFNIVFVFSLFCEIMVSDGPTQNFIIYRVYGQCEGPYSGNYTQISTLTTDSKCSQSSTERVSNNLLQLFPDGKKAVNSLQLLASSRYTQGATVKIEELRLATSGPLQGKYFYIKIEQLLRTYLKRCSSVLGLSMITSKTQIMISDKLNPEVLISPAGGFEAFKKGSNTFCNGTHIDYLI